VYGERNHTISTTSHRNDCQSPSHNFHQPPSQKSPSKKKASSGHRRHRLTWPGTADTSQRAVTSTVQTSLGLKGSRDPAVTACGSAGTLWTSFFVLWLPIAALTVVGTLHREEERGEERKAQLCQAMSVLSVQIGVSLFC
jgi:hypothetical protein